MCVEKAWLKEVLTRALAEDVGPGDITSNSLVPEQATTKAILHAKEEGTVAGTLVAEAVFHEVNPQLLTEIKIKDGDRVKPGQIIMTITGSARAILTAERLALNFLQRLSGIATKTNELVQLCSSYNVRIVDTRKTTPGLRLLEKYAVRMGGGYNHRFGLFDAVLIKDNHIKLAGGIANAVAQARLKAPHTIKVEVEVESMAQVEEALEAKADIIMLDNMDWATMKQAVKLIAGQALVEASGNVSAETIQGIAATGVDIISVGAITHSVKALDLSLDVGEIKGN